MADRGGEEERLEPSPRLFKGDEPIPIVDPGEVPKLESPLSVDLPATGRTSSHQPGTSSHHGATPAPVMAQDPAAVDQLKSAVEAVGLSEDAGHDLRLDQATFFRCVEEGNAATLEALLKNRKLDVNAYNDDGMTALHLAVYKFEQSRSLSIADILIRYGANVCAKAAGTPSTHRISIIRHDSKTLGLHETKKVEVHQKPPLLFALELKSSLFLKGWEYRHWDDMLKLLADATVQHYTARKLHEPVIHENAIPELIQNNWRRVFESGKHEVVEVWAEGKHVEALKLLLSGASKILKINIDSAAASNSNRIDIKDASFTIVKGMIEFLYTGLLDPVFVEHRGIDLFVAAHKHGVESLALRCEAAIVAVPDNWIKLLTVATECNSDVLAWKCAKSIKNLMETRHDRSRPLRHSYSESHDAPQQLFQPAK